MMSMQCVSKSGVAVTHLRLLLSLFVAILIAAGAFALNRQTPAAASPGSETNTALQPADSAVGLPMLQHETVRPATAATVSRLPRGESERLARQPWRTSPDAGTRGYPEDVVIELFAFVRNGVTAEEGFRVTRLLAGLAAHGEEAVPAIGEFLQGGEDVAFAGITGLNPDSSLRLCLFELLRRIGGEEAEAALVAELQSTSVPLEIATLARLLREQAPGQYDQLALQAARETLRLTAAGERASADVGPLFDVLQDDGDADVVPFLQQQPEQWRHYTALALAELPEAVGIPVLVDRVEQRLDAGMADPSHESAIYNDVGLFALQMLAQVASKYPQAREALIAQAAAGRIPEALWPKLTQALAGVYLFQSTKPDLDLSATVGQEAPQYPHVRIADGQVLYIRNRHGTDALSADERIRRLDVINEVISMTKSGQVVAALEQARDSLLAPGW